MVKRTTTGITITARITMARKARPRTPTLLPPVNGRNGTSSPRCCSPTVHRCCWPGMSLAGRKREQQRLLPGQRISGSTGKGCQKTTSRCASLRHLIALRAKQPLLRRESWRDGLEIRWFNAGGGPQQSEQWEEGSTIGVSISRPDLIREEGSGTTC